jgi:hypothetical protein
VNERSDGGHDTAQYNAAVQWTIKRRKTRYLRLAGKLCVTMAAVLAAWCGGDDCQLWARAAGAAIGGVPLWHATLEMRRQGCAARVCRARGRVQLLKTNPHVSPSIETLDRLHYSPRPRTRLDPR